MSALKRLRRLVPLLALALVVAACGGDGEPAEEPEDGEEAAEPAEPADEPVTVTIMENAVRGGKNAITADWLVEYAIPTFEEQMAEEGREVTVEFTESGVDDEDYKAQLALDLSVGEGPDVIGFDSFWLSEFVAAGYLEPLTQVVGPEVDEWEGWEQIPEAVAGSMALDDERYGLPSGTDGRVIFYRTDVFEEAGLDTDWQPTSWEEILETGRQLEGTVGTPIQVNAGTPMGEATTMQGVFPVLLGTGEQLYDDGWLGDTAEFREMLEFYDTVYSEGLGDADLQVRTEGRDRSFEEFANGDIAMLIEGDYLWRSVIHPEDGLFPVENRDEVVSWALIPAREPGAGIRGQDFVSASGGTGRVLNPNAEHPLEAWEFLSFLGSEEAQLDFVERETRITARQDVNESEAVTEDPLLEFISEEVLPITWYRPGFEEYPQISEELQRTVENVVAGRASVEEAGQQWQASLESIVGPDEVRSDQ